MQIKTFVENTAEKMDKAVNEWEKTHRVRATQTECVYCGDTILFRATVFFEE